MFMSTMNKGFNMTFENGYTASVQWGDGNYATGHHPGPYGEESPTAEVAVFHNHAMINANQFIPEELQSMDTVVGFLTADQVVDFLMRVKMAK